METPRGVTDLSSGLGPERHTLLGRAEAVAQSGSWEWNLETDQIAWSDNLFRIYGLEPGDITPAPEYVLERTHPDDRDRVGRALDDARQGLRISALEYRIIRTDGDMRHLRALQAMGEEPGGGRQTLVGRVSDVTDSWRAQRQIAAHLAVSESLSRWETFEDGIDHLLSGLARALECLAGTLWVPQGDFLVARAFWHSQYTDASELEAEVHGHRLRRLVGLSGVAWETRKPQVHSDFGEGPGTTKTGFESLVAVPALHHYEVVAVFEFYSSEPLSTEFSERLLRSLTGIGYELGQFLAAHRGDLSPSILTPRELEVLQLAAGGRTAPEIAQELVVSPSTIASHFKNIYGKYGVSDRASAVAKALREGLIE